MLSDEDWLPEIQERLADPIRSGFMGRIDQQELAWCVSEIARLRAENEKIRAARLRPETVEIVRRALDFYYGKSMELPPAFRGGDYDEVPVALADLNRCYPPEEE